VVVKEGELTKRQGVFYELWAKTGFDPKKKTECARRAEYPYPAQSAYKIAHSSRVNELMKNEMIRQGYTPEEIIMELKRLSFKAMNPFQKKMPDNKERRESIKMGLQLFDAFPPKKVDIHKTEAHFDINVETVKKLDEELGRETIINVEPVDEGEEEVEPF